jgi:tetratricopeptide (TPR) repeat protein
MSIMTQRFPRGCRLAEFYHIRCYLLLLLTLPAGRGFAQGSDYWPDSLKRELAKATDGKQKAQLAGNLSLYYFGQDRPLSDEYGRQAIEAAEITRDRMLMINTYLTDGKRFEQGVGLKANLEIALEDFRRAVQIAKEDKLDEGLVLTDAAFADLYRTLGDNVQALAYSNHAVTTAGDLSDDSVQVIAYASLGLSYEARNEKLLAFRNYLKALDIAEDGKNLYLIRTASIYLAYFYHNIHEEDKAIDYLLNAVIPDDREMKHYYELRADYNTLAQFFTRKKSYDIALECYDHAIRLCDTIHFDLVKIDSYFGMFDTYFKSGQYKMGLAYMNAHPIVSDYLSHAQMHFVVDGIYADAYMDMGMYDSAAWYFNRELPEIESKANVPSRIDFYDRLGDFYKRRGMLAQAVDYFRKEELLGRSTGDLQVLQQAAQNLDDVYRRQNDFRNAYSYHTLYVQYSDSLRALTKETDLLKLEVDNDNKRREKQVREDELAREHRHNVQYMGFTVGIVVLFIALVMMGWLAVPPSVIRALAFLSFIFLFEFIILITDKQIAEITHEEPWKVLLIKIALAAVLLPLHHWSEHRVIHFLSRRKRFKEARPVAMPAASEAGVL